MKSYYITMISVISDAGLASSSHYYHTFSLVIGNNIFACVEEMQLQLLMKLFSLT